MDEDIDVSLARVRRCIAECQQTSPSGTFKTTEVIDRYLGHFHSDVGTPPAFSFNAQFGKLLKRNEAELGIVEVGCARAHPGRQRQGYLHVAMESALIETVSSPTARPRPRLASCKLPALIFVHVGLIAVLAG